MSDSVTSWAVTRQASLSHHHLPELAQIHVHRVSDAIQPSHPLLSPSPPAFSLSQHQGLFQQHQGLFQWVSSSHQVAKVLELQHQSFQWLSQTDFLRINWLDLFVVQGTLKSLLQHHSLNDQFFKSISSKYSSLFLLMCSLSGFSDGCLGK